jgi:hypothetical protein
MAGTLAPGLGSPRPHLRRDCTPRRRYASAAVRTYDTLHKTPVYNVTAVRACDHSAAAALRCKTAGGGLAD